MIPIIPTQSAISANAKFRVFGKDITVGFTLDANNANSVRDAIVGELTKVFTCERAAGHLLGIALGAFWLWFAAAVHK